MKMFNVITTSPEGRLPYLNIRMCQRDVNTYITTISKIMEEGQNAVSHITITVIPVCEGG